MKKTSIQTRLYVVIVFIVLIVSFVLLNYYLNRVANSIDRKYHGISECDQKFSDIIFHEQTALNDPSQFDGLLGKYAVLEKMCAKYHSGSNKFLSERETAFNKLFKISKETRKTYSDVHTILLNLIADVKYIHEHHIAYLKNLFRRNTPKQDYDTGGAFKRSSVKSATEPDIIKVAVSIQSSLASVHDIFYRMQRDEDLKEVERAFSEKIKRFFLDVITFENDSLDAQDGILVEELLQSGRQFEKLFRYLLTAEQEKMNLMVQLKRNRARLLETLVMARSSMKAKYDRISKQSELIQFVTLLFSILLAGWVVFNGKQIIGQIKKGIAETNKIEKDLLYRIEIDNSMPAEFKALLREIYHRTKNNMQVMISLLKIQSANIEDKQVAEMFKESRDRIRSMALVHEKLYQSKGLADVDFKGYVKSLVSSIFSSYGARASGITSIAETDDVSIGLETAIPCGLIINELVSNSLKYAFPGNRKGEIRVALRSFDEDALVLEVGDNGIGMPEDLDFRNTASMGLYLVNILSEDQLHGKIELDRAGGTTFRIRFKNHKYAARI